MNEVQYSIPISNLQSNIPSIEEEISRCTTWGTIIASEVSLHRFHTTKLPTELDGPCLTKICTYMVVNGKLTYSRNAGFVPSKSIKLYPSTKPVDIKARMTEQLHWDAKGLLDIKEKNALEKEVGSKSKS